MQPFIKGRLLPFLVLFLGMWVNSAAAQECKPEVTAPQGTSLCNTASVVLKASDAESYTWSTGQTTQTISVSKPGDYRVTTRTADGCEGTSETITIAGAPDASLTDPDYPELNFTYCSYSGNTANFKFNLTVENTSATKATNKEYHISWGDGKTNTYGKTLIRQRTPIPLPAATTLF